MRFLVALFAAAAFASTFDIGAPKSSMILGEEMQLTVVVRNTDGTIRQVSDIAWESLDEKVLTVDSAGKAVSKGFGLARVKVGAPSIPNLFGEIDLAVVPGRLSIDPGRAEMFTGERLAFTAQAYDIADQPAPAQFEWQADSARGLSSQIVSVDANGVVSATATGVVTIRAKLVYPLREGQPAQLEAAANLVVRLRPSYAIERRLTADLDRQSFALRPAPGFLAANDPGALLLSGSLDAYASAAMEFSGGSLRALVSSGAAAPFPGGVIPGFQSASLNNRGRSIVSVPSGAGRKDGGILECERGECRYVLLDGVAFDQIGNDFSYQTVTPYSLNDNGEFLFRALFALDDGVYRDGLFLRTPDGGVELVWDSRRPLPGLDSRRIDFTLDYPARAGWIAGAGFGLDDQGNATFLGMAHDLPGRRGLYRIPRGGQPVALAQLGGQITGGRTITSITNLVILRSGDLAMQIAAGGTPYVSRWRAGAFEHLALRADPDIRVLAANANTILFYGSGSSTAISQKGLHRWTAGQTRSELVLAFGAAIDGLGNVSEIDQAQISASGEIHAVVKTLSTPFAVLRIAGTATTVVLRSGATVAQPASLHMRSLLQGRRSQFVSLTLGEPSSLFALSATGPPAPRISLGDTLPDRSVFLGATEAIETGANVLTFSSDGVYRLTGATPSVVANFRDRDGTIDLLQPKLWAVNEAGASVVEYNTSAGHRRLYLITGPAARALVARSDEIQNWEQIALDESNRVMLLATRGGVRGYHLWTAGSWSTRLTVGRDSFAGETVVEAWGLKAAGNRFYSRAVLTAGYYHAAIVEFDGSWTVRVKSGDALPTGSPLGFLLDFDVNSTGAVAVHASQDGNSVPALFVEDRGSVKIVQVASDPVTGSDYLQRFDGLNIRDDGTVHFTAFDAADRPALYTARPR
jgi:hypothetical protein